MELSQEYKTSVISQLRHAVDYQGKLLDADSSLAELLNLPFEQVFSLVQELSATADTGEDLTQEDIEWFFDWVTKPR